jgi:hypothetical protein
MSLLFHHFNLTEEVIFLVHACISNGIKIMYFLECLYIFVYRNSYIYYMTITC